MSWTRHMTMGRSKVSNTLQHDNTQPQGMKTNFASYLPAVYTGVANRIDRYRQYDQMDQDPEIRTALNIIADFCTQSEEDFGIPFRIKYQDDMGDTEVTTLEDRLESWCDLNEFKLRIYDIIRGILKYGDQFFIRDPETFEWYWVSPMDVDKVIVNEETGKNPVVYFIRNVSLNIRDKVMSNMSMGTVNQSYGTGGGMGNSGGAAQYSGSGISTGADSSNPFGTNGQLDVLPVAAEHVIHLSLNTGQDQFWPFGNSILEHIFKIYKQKELLEDSIIIYRVQRAPERRVFKIDVGDMQPHQAMAMVERVKNDIHQRRIPSSKGGSSSLMDAAYNPLSIMEDYFFPQTAEGRGSSVDTLPGGDNLGQIDDLRYFNNQLIRGLQIPASYLPMGPDDGGVAMFGEGSTQVMASENRFNSECMRYQRIISRTFDSEFKRFMIKNGHNINASSFVVNFYPPRNFAANRKAEMDAKLIQTYMPLNDLPYMSKQFIMKKMGLDQADIIENERLWMQENPEAAKSISAQGDSSTAGLNSVGIDDPNAPDIDLGMDDDGNMKGADDEYQNQQGGSSGFDPGSLGDSF